MKKVITIVGTTASGKTDLAHRLFDRGKYDIFSIDSRQIYTGLDIGTGKDKSFKQYGIDLFSVDEMKNVVDFTDKILPDIKLSLKKSQVPVLVGGTFFWLENILYTSLNGGASPNNKIRNKLEELSSSDIYEKLSDLDPESAARIGHHRRRLIRALEINILTGHPVPKVEPKKRFDFIMVAFNISRENLRKKLKIRFDGWIESGLIEEIEWLKSKTSPEFIDQLGLHYRILNQYLDGEFGYEVACDKCLTSLYRYAIRQLTWLKRYKDIVWVDKADEALKAIDEFTQKV